MSTGPEAALTAGSICKWHARNGMAELPTVDVVFPRGYQH